MVSIQQKYVLNTHNGKMLSWIFSCHHKDDANDHWFLPEHMFVFHAQCPVFPFLVRVLIVQSFRVRIGCSPLLVARRCSPLLAAFLKWGLYGNEAPNKNPSICGPRLPMASLGGRPLWWEGGHRHKNGHYITLHYITLHYIHTYIHRWLMLYMYVFICV